MTANQANQTDSFPLPHVDELFANLSGGKYFYKLDMFNEYLQLPLTKPPKKVVAIHTHKGLFKYNCLPFSVSSAPLIFCLTWSNRSLSVSR